MIWNRCTLNQTSKKIVAMIEPSYCSYSQEPILIKKYINIWKKLHVSKPLQHNLRTNKIYKMPMGHIAHLRNQFKSSTLWLYHSVDLERRKATISIFIIKLPLFVKPWVPFTQGCLMRSLVEINPMVLTKKIFKFRQCIFAVS